MVSLWEAEWKKSPSRRKKGMRLADAADADRGGSDEERSANSIYGSAEDKKSPQDKCRSSFLRLAEAS